MKLDAEDYSVEQYGPFTKRSRVSSNFDQQWSTGTDEFSNPSWQYDPLESPLGLRLRKSPSLLDLIQMRLSQGYNTSGLIASPTGIHSSGDDNNKDVKDTLSYSEKLKASNFPASFLKIGCWEYKSTHEGDLVAKCYFAKHKLVWEILEGGLKSKIEVQWSDIMGLKEKCPDNGFSTLNVVLARQPLFFKETNPQPRKHTLWQATADFTAGQASIYREHLLHFPHGVLSKQFEKLVQCDARLYFLSQHPQIAIDSPYFEEPNCTVIAPRGFNKLEAIQVPNISDFIVATSFPAAQSSSMIGQHDPVIQAVDHFSREAHSPRSVIDAIEGNASYESSNKRVKRNLEQLKSPELHRSISIGDFMTHIGNHILEQITYENQPLLDENPDCREKLEDIAQCLLSDAQVTTYDDSDEKYVMSRVNSFCCLLQMDHENTECVDGVKNVQPKSMGFEGESIGRIDSYGDMRHCLPQIATLPKFLYDIWEGE